MTQARSIILLLFLIPCTTCFVVTKQRTLQLAPIRRPLHVPPLHAGASTGNINRQQNDDIEPDQIQADREFLVVWTVADVFSSQPLSALVYHVMSAPYALASPVGAIVGACYGLLTHQENILQSMANGSLALGIVGTMVGLSGLVYTAKQGEQVSPPFTPDGILDRRDRLKVNYVARVLDRSVWIGVVAAAAAALTPLELGLAPGTLGFVQALALGSTVGGVVGLVGVGQYKKYMLEKEEQQDNSSASNQARSA